MTDDENVYFGDAVVSPAASVRPSKEQVAAEYIEVHDMMVALRGRQKLLKEIIAAELPQEPGDYPIEVDDETTLLVTIPEKWSWDKKGLREYFPAGSAPDCVTLSYSVDRGLFEQAEPNVKEVLSTLLTIGPGAPSFKVERL